jgi:6-pyruvoyltetrahydropterin/6-carboxytetrahydropterin synthase
MIDQAILNCDGGSRGNPGDSGIGFTIGVDDGRGVETICRGGWYVGRMTNNQAEYRALIWGLQNARALGVRRLDVAADSELMVKQLNGAYKVKNEGIKPLYLEAKRLLEGFERTRVRHVLREYNAAADALANEAMDQKTPTGDYQVPYETMDMGLFDDQECEKENVGAVLTARQQEGDLLDCHPALDAGSRGGLQQNGRDGGSQSSGTNTRLAVGDPQDDPRTSERNPGMYTLTIKEHFDAAHALIGYPGQCKNLHGHTWDIEVSVRGNRLDEVGIVYDFKDLKANLMSILDDYDHKFLNEVPPFDEINATAENLARVIYEQMELLLPEGIELVEIAVWESPIAKLTYTKE